MREVAAEFVQAAAKGSRGRVGRFVHVDSTEAETHARLEHVCPTTSSCWKARREGTHYETRVSAHAPTGAVRAGRHTRAAAPEPERLELVEDTDIGAADAVTRTDDRVIVTVGGCQWALLDPTAGVRPKSTRTASSSVSGSASTTQRPSTTSPARRWPSRSPRPPPPSTSPTGTSTRPPTPTSARSPSPWSGTAAIRSPPCSSTTLGPASHRSSLARAQAPHRPRGRRLRPARPPRRRTLQALRLSDPLRLLHHHRRHRPRAPSLWSA